MDYKDDLQGALEECGFDVPERCDIVRYAIYCIDALTDAIDWACAVACEVDADGYDRRDSGMLRNPTNAVRWLAGENDRHRSQMRGLESLMEHLGKSREDYAKTCADKMDERTIGPRVRVQTDYD